MKKLLSTAAVAALLSTAGVAHADNIAWSGQTPGIFPGSTISYSGAIGHFGYNIATAIGGVGYDQSGSNAGNADTANSDVTNTWTISGNVTKDCSYYGGSSTSHTLDFGTIGVNTQAATSVGSAFNMMSAAVATVNSTTAGCNFNNDVSITKSNGADGMKNIAAGGYDTNNFQANIPYSVAATFTAGAQGAVAAANSQTLTAGTGDASKVGHYGAWRSNMTMVVNAPVPPKALVAGNYSDTLTVELKAL
ncbi:MAG TPA: hypothetical protein VN137_05070 [Sphingomonas sp.]|nr:hypothetical protein [Sphingomonas sp.]